MYLNKKTKKAISIISITIVFLFGFFILSNVVLAAYGLEESAPAELTKNTDDVSLIVGKVVGGALAFIGVIFLMLMIYGGFLWMMARGNEQEVTKAKDLIIAAIIGLIIVMSAYAITKYIGGVLVPTTSTTAPAAEVAK